MYTVLDAIRQLRNRIAHHEPIVNRHLGDDLTRIFELIDLRSQPTAARVRDLEDVTQILTKRP
ncbi:hypothetical protein C5C55_03650 [Rathayibacter sp. AY1C2]|nr:hypothetical protein C5C55_03650 [Rathayibacter sp. AY1C2]